MPIPESDLSDIDKLKRALSSISSANDILAAFGLHDMPAAQKYGILLGCIVFFVTVASVLILLTLGGSWKRIEEQAKSGELVSAPDAITQRKKRALLLERLLENRDWMIKTNYPSVGGSGSGFTGLTRMLMTVAPVEGEVPPEGYEESYRGAYRRCQDKPGGEFEFVSIVVDRVYLFVLNTQRLNQNNATTSTT
jgi:hypothetical protein